MSDTIKYNKKCSKCQEIKELSHFSKRGRGNSLSSWCDICKKYSTQENRNKIRTIEKPVITHKTCNVCKKNLEIDRFCKVSTMKDGYNSFCKDCRREKDKKRKGDKQQEERTQEHFHKLCRKCNKMKICTFFRENHQSKDGYSYTCKECIPPSTWTKEKQRESEKKYVKNNIEKIRLKWKKQGKNINRRVRDSLNHRISEALFTNRVTKNNKTTKYVGCSIDFLKKWMEFLFIDGMTWENYGEWHIDHVVPCSSFNLAITEDQIKCFNWKNLQPLWKLDNIQKGDKIDHDMLKIHYVKVESFSAQVKEGELREHPKVLSTKIDSVKSDWPE